MQESTLYGSAESTTILVDDTNGCEGQSLKIWSRNATVVGSNGRRKWWGHISKISQVLPIKYVFFWWFGFPCWLGRRPFAYKPLGMPKNQVSSLSSAFSGIFLRLKTLQQIVPRPSGILKQAFTGHFEPYYTRISQCKFHTPFKLAISRPTMRKHGGASGGKLLCFTAVHCTGGPLW